MSVSLSHLQHTEEDDLKIVHPNAIMRYLARKTDLYGKDERERIYCEMWEEQCEMVLQDFWNASFMTQNNLSAFREQELRISYFDQTLVPQLKAICRMMLENEHAFLIGPKLTYVDIKLYSLLDALEREIKLVFASFPLLEAFHKTIDSRPAIKTLNASGKRF